MFIILVNEKNGIKDLPLKSPKWGTSKYLKPPYGGLGGKKDKRYNDFGF